MVLFPNGIIFKSREVLPLRSALDRDRIQSLLVSHLLWKVARRYSDFSIAVANRDRWLIRLNKYYWSVIASEYYGEWERFYLPPRTKDVKGKRILDVGAGWGETCAFYFDKGASKVIAVEVNKESAERIKMNAALNDWRIEVINSSFDTSCIANKEIDIAKVDCEGGETALLGLEGIPFQLVGEIHGRKIMGEMLSKFPRFFIRKTFYSEEFGNLFYVYMKGPL